MKIVSIHPVLPSSDLDRDLLFYEKLGFEIAWKWGQPVSRVGLARDAIELQLLSDPALRPAAPAQVYFHVRGIAPLHEHFRASGAAPSELVAREWGMLDFRLSDPSGNQLGFGESDR